MAKSKGINLDLPSVDDLFTTQEKREEQNLEKVMDIPVDLIDDFPNHPFKVLDDSEMIDLGTSIKEYGVLVPALVRPKEDGRYEMVAGHRRKHATILTEKTDLPCIVRNLTDDEAILIMVDSNLQREHILPSEKAFAYKMKLDAMKRQGKRADLTCAPMEHKSKGVKSRDLLATQSEDSREQIRRYIRLTELLPEILEMVDNNKIAFRPAVEISYLTIAEQESLLDSMRSEDCTPSLAQAIKMKSFSKEGKLEEAVIASILQEEKPNQVEQFKIPQNRISKYFPKGTPKKKMEDTIVSALEMYQKRQRNKDMER
ncbi:ParB/RepB/Spo0J family partition protein [Muricomes sp. OA1]|uniref:ParB/RepB/Spo0J family partition protein n=1 Tax=Lachnospiraceae TaxID=186803 RepID=UPI00047008B5|nr:MULTISPECIES: ParB/RepB/Spo0J family partition protein [Lachnospiraceae]MCH1975511.1 ParB/RepB/Spo0J family partition protein [Muricomes sp. OA1]MRM88514.1 ParB/RepB/Spo0J family partition protein [Faecalicatena contorta]